MASLAISYCYYHLKWQNQLYYKEIKYNMYDAFLCATYILQRAKRNHYASLLETYKSIRGRHIVYCNHQKKKDRKTEAQFKLNDGSISPPTPNPNSQPPTPQPSPPPPPPHTHTQPPSPTPPPPPHTHTHPQPTPPPTHTHTTHTHMHTQKYLNGVFVNFGPTLASNSKQARNQTFYPRNKKGIPFCCLIYPLTKLLCLINH